MCTGSQCYGEFVLERPSATQRITFPLEVLLTEETSTLEVNIFVITLFFKLIINVITFAFVQPRSTRAHSKDYCIPMNTTCYNKNTG